jgi:hypothetical protein
MPTSEPVPRLLQDSLCIKPDGPIPASGGRTANDGIGLCQPLFDQLLKPGPVREHVVGEPDPLVLAADQAGGFKRREGRDVSCITLKEGKALHQLVGLRGRDPLQQRAAGKATRPGLDEMRPEPVDDRRQRDQLGRVGKPAALMESDDPVENLQVAE